MSGKILIVDELATNRIVLKVRLSGTNFDLLQARDGAEALRMAQQDRPDLILVSAALGDMGGNGLIAALRARPDLAHLPVVLVLPEDSAQARMRAFQAGADDVIAHPLDEQVVLARLRVLLRQHNALQDLRLQAGPGRSAGLAEAQTLFQPAGRVALIAPDRREAMTLRARLADHTRHALSTLDRDGLLAEPAADLYVISLASGAPETGLRIMSELRSAALTRHSRIMALVPEGATDLTATLLDMGASDVMTAPPAPDELILRMTRQIRHKRAADTLRDRLRDGMRAAMTDPLTGLYNRRFALPFLRQLTESADPAADPFAVMVADLDHFKRINDTYGHSAGDRVLVHVADLLRRNLRGDDMIARIGGEEFLIVLPGTGRAAALDLADRLCGIIRQTPLPASRGSGAIDVTVSIGITLGHTQPGAARIPAETLIEQADRALYAAKARGRNTVRLNARPAA